METGKNSFPKCLFAGTGVHRSALEHAQACIHTHACSQLPSKDGKEQEETFVNEGDERSKDPTSPC